MIIQARNDIVNCEETTKPPRSRLPILTAELRTRIYEYTLTEKHRIAINAQLVQPVLLSTCRQVRKDAIELWYLSNTFGIETVSHHPDFATGNLFKERAKNTLGDDASLKVKYEGMADGKPLSVPLNEIMHLQHYLCELQKALGP